MFIVKRSFSLIDIKQNLRLYSLARRNHYDVLNLRRNCSDKEIKDAFIKMSKEFHPDINKDVRAQEQFIRILEAYNVLSKPSSRAQYDSIIDVQNRQGGTSYVYRTHVPYNLRKNPKYNYYNQETQNTAQSTENPKPYYGIKGISKLPNSVLIAICVGLGVFGLIIQMFAIRESFLQRRRQSDERTRYLSEELEKVREAAHQNGNEMQTRILLDKIVGASNATVATASLGQALSGENKGSVESAFIEFGITEVPDNWSQCAPRCNDEKDDIQTLHVSSKD